MKRTALTGRRGASREGVARATLTTDLDVEVRGVAKQFDNTVALRPVDLEVHHGEFVTLLGPSGCGKSTLLRLIAGLERPDAGEILISGRRMNGVSPHRRPVSMVFQNLALFPHLTVAQNIGFPLMMAGLRKSDARRIVEEYLNLVQLSQFAERSVTELSGGQRQRVALARSLAHEPTVLLLDEPLSALDAKLRKQMQVELKNFQRATGTTFIFVTHDQEEALVMSDRIAVFSNGEIEQIGGPLEVYSKPKTRFVADFVGETNMLLASTTGTSGRSWPRYAEIGNEVGFPDSAHRESEVWVSVRPEHVIVARAADGFQETPYFEPIAATIQDILFYGTSVKLVMKLKNGTELISRDEVGAFQRRLAVGEAVLAHWNPDNVALFNAHEASST